jgi:hypothetical protein
MTSRISNTSHSKAAVSSDRNGCRFVYLAPPLAVLCVGALFLFIALTSPTVPAMAELLDNGDPTEVTSAFIQLSPVFTPEVQYWAEKIQNWAADAGLDPNLVGTVMQIESCGDPSALSTSGAMGLFQVMPYHFTSSDDPYDPDTNALRGLDYLLRSYTKAEGNPRLALAGYNGGIGMIGLFETEWSLQTQRYAAWGSGIYDEASRGEVTSLHLQDWLTSNGFYLCKHAHEKLGITP